MAWAEVSNNEVRAAEFAILHQIDLAFCEETNKELQAYRERFTSNDAPPATAPRKARARK